MEVRGRADPSAGRAGVLAVDSQIPELWRTRFCRSRAVQSAASCRGSRNRLTIGVWESLHLADVGCARRAGGMSHGQNVTVRTFLL